MRRQCWHPPLAWTSPPPPPPVHLLHTGLQARELQGRNPLVLFSGDAFNPSLMSTITLGTQMVPILNEIGVQVRSDGRGA